MKTFLINDELKAVYPDPFQEMTEEEKYAVLRDRGFKNFGIWDHEGHVIITFAWKDMGRIMLFFADPRTMARKTRKYSGRLIPDFEAGDIREMTVAGRRAYGFSYTYTAGGVKHRGFTVLLKTDRTMYTINGAVREEDEKGKETFRSVLGALTL